MNNSQDLETFFDLDKKYIVRKKQIHDNFGNLVEEEIIYDYKKQQQDLYNKRMKRLELQSIKQDNNLIKIITIILLIITVIIISNIMWLKEVK